MMALRTVRLTGDELLRKKSRDVKEITDNIRTLVSDMYETMDSKEGLGLAAPQVGVLRRVVVVNVTEEDNERRFEMINPRIIESDGEQENMEACLSVPLKNGLVKRPEFLRVAYMDLDGKEHEVEAHGFFAVVLAHEIDHLEGVLYTDKAVEMYEYSEKDNEDDEEDEDGDDE